MTCRTLSDAPDVEMLKQHVGVTLADLQALADAGVTTALDPIFGRLGAQLADPRLPSGLVRGVRAQARALELAVNMKACDLALRHALASPGARRKPQRAIRG